MSDQSFYRLNWKCRLCETRFEEGIIPEDVASFAIDDLLRTGVTGRTHPHQSSTRWHTCMGEPERLGICDLQGFVHQKWPLIEKGADEQASLPKP